MQLMPITDSMFLLMESREHPMHVGGLQLFDLPPGAGPGFVSDLYQELLQHTELRSLFRKRPADPVSSFGQLWWQDDDEVDLEYHVRLTALPSPNKIRQLLELTSRLHSGLLDRHRPLWEFYLIEGVEGNRFAAYTKVHHALVDGVAATRLLSGFLSEDAEATCQPFWAKRPPRRDAPTAVQRVQSTVDNVFSQVKSVAKVVGEMATGTPALAKVTAQAVRGSERFPIPGPKTMLNGPITGARRFAAQSWDMDRVKKAAAEGGASLNDVVLAMCSGALRRYLLDQDALPDQPLIACVPVGLALRGGGDTTGEGGNAVGAVLCNLATHEDDPQRRLAVISNSMRQNKEQLAEHTKVQIQTLAAVIMGTPALLAMVPGAADTLRPVYNLVISNVPGPKRPLYLNGARLRGSYPVSIPTEGQALNITVVSYAGSLEFGLIGCRRRVPHLQRLLGYLEDSLAELEAA